MKKNIHFSMVLIGLQRQKLNINSELLAGALQILPVVSFLQCMMGIAKVHKLSWRKMRQV